MVHDVLAEIPPGWMAAAFLVMNWGAMAAVPVMGHPHGPAVVKLPQLNIAQGRVVVAGQSHAADFAHQFHVAFSGRVSGSCVFSGQPYHCAVERFVGDALVDLTPESSVPRCDDCPDGKTLIYDHCKNHPQWIDVGRLPDYLRRACGQNPITRTACIDDPQSLLDARVYLFRGTHDRCYLPGAVENTHALLAQLVTNPASQLKLVNTLPFPHTLPTNSTPFYNSSTGAGYDGPGECLRWVWADRPLARAAPQPIPANFLTFDQEEFMDVHDAGAGLQSVGYAYVPTRCRRLPVERASSPCRLLLLPSGCHANQMGQWAPGNSDAVFVRYAETNGFAVIKACVGGKVNLTKYPGANEVARGLLDVYGQLTEDYAMQSAPHMRVIARILRRAAGRQ